MTTHKNWSTEEKLRIVLEGLHPNANVEGVCRAHGVHSSQFYKWKVAAFDGMKAGLASGPRQFRVTGSERL